MTFFNYVIIREDYKHLIGGRTFRHEAIHQAQAYDFGIGFCGYFVFYLLYLLEWVLKLPWAIFGYKPYKNISFEREAYNNDINPNYLPTRRKFTWLKYIFKMSKYV